MADQTVTGPVRDAQPAGGAGSLFVGHREAMQLLDAALAAGIAGEGRMVLVSGEPGIGKTRCAEELTRVAEDQGALTLWGRCYEHPGAPPFWPWVQILRSHAEASSDDELRLLLGSDVDTVAMLVPEVGRRLGVAPRRSGVNERALQRFTVFDALRRVLANAATAVPLLLIIDDLHWADASSLSLLEFLARDRGRHRMLIVCAYRDVEVTRNSPLLATLGELTQGHRVERVRLSGLGREDTARLTSAVAGVALPPQVVEAVFQQTDGNPLFVNEVARVIDDQYRAAGGDTIVVDVPDGVREAIGRRLNRLSPCCNDLLPAASAIGRDFDLRILAHVTNRPVAECLAEMDEAGHAGIVTASVHDAGSYRFTHALIRETLYEEQSTHERVRLHQQIARALAEIHRSDLDPVLSELVHHFCEASVLGDTETAVDFALRAAAHDEQLYAYEEACKHYDAALRMLTIGGRQGDRRAANAYLRKGINSAKSGRFKESIDSLIQGIALARQQDDPHLFATFAIGLVRYSSFGAQSHGAALLEEALELLSEDDTKDRALVLGHLAFALRERGDPAAVARRGEEAIALARTVGDRLILATVLRFVLQGLRSWAETLTQRLAHGEEMLELLATVDDPDERGDACWWHLLNLLEAGDMGRFGQVLELYDRRVTEYQLPRHRYHVAVLEIVLNLLHGEWSAAERAIEASYAASSSYRNDAFGTPDGAYGAQMFALERELGHLRGMGPLLQRMIDDGRSRLWKPGLVVMCCEAGLDGQARATLDELAADGFAAIQRDDMWAASIAFCAEASARLGDPDRAAVLYELLQPFDGQTINYPTASCFGAASTFLGMLAHTMGRQDDARTHYAAGMEMNRRIGAWPALVRTQYWLGRLLLGTGSAEDDAGGRRLLQEAEQLAVRFRMAGVAADIEELLRGNAVRLPDGLTVREAEVLKLLAIGRSNKDISRVLAISLSTVATHVRSILGKTGCANRTEAAAYANRHSLT